MKEEEETKARGVSERKTAYWEHFIKAAQEGTLEPRSWENNQIPCRTEQYKDQDQIP